MITVAIADCSIVTPSHACFNRLVTSLDVKLHYHAPSRFGLTSLENSPNFDFLIIFGSASNIEDHLPWHRPLASFADNCLQKGIPVLGLCFGHQLMAHHYEAQIVRNEQHQNFYGTRKVHFHHRLGPYQEGDEITLFKAHSFTVAPLHPNLPLQVLGSSQECTTDIICHKSLPYIGFQTHPEASLFFYENEISKKGDVLTEKEVYQALSDGLKVIKNFVAGEMTKHNL